MNVKTSNDRFLFLMSSFLNNFDSIINKEDLLSVQSVGLSEEEAFCHLLAAHCGIDAYGKDRQFFNDYFLQSIKKLDVNDFYNDPYYKTVSFEGEALLDSKLTYQTYAPYQGFVRDDFKFLPDGRVIPLIGYFDCPYKYPAVLTNDIPWMTLLPNEINSQKKYIQKAKGRVLTYGLGLGYYVFMAAIKKEVSHITVVDLNDNVINLFKKHILCKFPLNVQNKITIIKSDAFEFAEKLSDNDFDYIYADIWHDCGDGKLLYLKFKQAEKYCKTAEYGYWIEDSIKYYL